MSIFPQTNLKTKNAYYRKSMASYYRQISKEMSSIKKNSLHYNYLCTKIDRLLPLDLNFYHTIKKYDYKMGLWMAKKKDVLVNLHIKEILSYLHIIKSFKQLLWICTTVPKVFGNCNVMKNLNKNQQSKNLKTIHQNKKGHATLHLR